MFEQYEHRGYSVWVRGDLRGKHTEHCLCYSCESFHPNSKENCPIAAALYAFDVLCALTTPVWECPIFKEQK